MRTGQMKPFHFQTDPPGRPFSFGKREQEDAFNWGLDGGKTAILAKEEKGK